MTEVDESTAVETVYHIANKKLMNIEEVLHILIDNINKSIADINTAQNELADIVKKYANK